MPRFALRLSIDRSSRTQSLFMLLVLILDRANKAHRRRVKCADLLRPTSLPFDQKVDSTALAHVALHPRGPRIPARAIYTQSDIQGVQDATQRPKRLEQIRSLGRPALAVRVGDCEQLVPAATARRQRPPLFASAGPHRDKMILSHDADRRRPELGNCGRFTLMAAVGLCEVLEFG